VIFFVVREGHSFGFQYFLEDRAGAKRDAFRILGVDDLLHDRRADPGTYVFAVDDMLPAERALLGSVWDQLRGHDGRVRLLNHPLHTLGRFALLRALHASGRSRVQVVRATDRMESLRFPVFLREETRHSGNLSALLNSPDEVRRELRRLTLRGFHRRELLAVEFCDTADARGIYRKYSAYVVGDRVIPRCLEFGRDWMVKHDPGTYDADRIAEEEEYVRTNPHEAQLRESFAAASVQYGRIDYALRDGQLQVWEINLNPTIGRHRPHTQDSADVKRVRELRRGTNDIFYSRFLDAWQAVDTDPARPDPIAFEVERHLLDAVHAERAEARRGERHKQAVEWIMSRRAISSAWRIVKPALRRGKALFSRGWAAVQP